MSNSWVYEDTETLKTMWADGSSATQIAWALPGNRTRSAVLGRVHRLKLAQRAPTPKINRSRIRNNDTGIAAVKVLRPPVISAEDPGPIDPPINTLTLHDRHCKWPYDVGATYHYCGKAPEKGHSWCLYHCGKAYQPQQPRKSAA